MHARIVTVRVQAGKLDEAVRIARDSVLPAAQQQPGFQGGFVLTDAVTNRLVGITLWESEAALVASETGYFDNHLAKATRLFDEPSLVGRYEVRVQVSGRSAGDGAADKG